jgi:hypothetical protein
VDAGKCVQDVTGRNRKAGESVSLDGFIKFVETEHNDMRPQDWVHVGSVIQQHDLTRDKYTNGRKEHGGDCWAKPGMLAHALEESADLPVYLWTLRKQLTDLAAECEGGTLTLAEVAARIRYVIHK